MIFRATVFVPKSPKCADIALGPDFPGLVKRRKPDDIDIVFLGPAMRIDKILDRIFERRKCPAGGVPWIFPSRISRTSMRKSSIDNADMSMPDKDSLR